MKKIIFLAAILFSGLVNAQIYVGELNESDSDSIPTYNQGGIIDGYRSVTSIKENVAFENFNYVRQRRETPLLEASESGWDQTLRENGNVIEVNGTLVMIYSGYSGSYTGNNVYIGLATSTDNGETWQKGNNNGNIIPDRSMEDGYIVYDSGTYYLFAEHKEEVPFKNICLYTTTDLINWNYQGNVLTPDAGIDWEKQDVSSPTALIENNQIYLFYEGRGLAPNEEVNGGAVGLAISNIQTIDFQKDANNPVISALPFEGQLNWAESVVPDDIIKENDKYYLTYHGFDGVYYFAAGMALSESLDSGWRDFGQILIEANVNLIGQDLVFYPFEGGLKFIYTSFDQKSRILGKASNYTKNEIDKFFVNTPQLEEYTAQEINKIQIGARNYFDLDSIENLAVAGGGTINSFADAVSFVMPVSPGEYYSISRQENTNSRFRLVFTEVEPADGVSWFSGMENQPPHDNNLLRIENYKVPDNCNYAVFYLSISSEDVSVVKPKIEKGTIATDWTANPDDLAKLNQTNTFNGTQNIDGDVNVTGNVVVEEATEPDEVVTLAQLERISITVTSTLDFPSVSANSNTSLTVTVTGAEIGDAVSLGVPNGSMLTGNIDFFAWVSAADTVTIRFMNNSNMSPKDLPSGSFTVKVFK